MIGISQISTYFPEEKSSYEELPGNEVFKEEEKKYFDDIGIKSVRLSEEDGYELAQKAAKKLIEEASLNPEKIDLIIFIQCRLPQYFMSSSATKLQADIGAENAITYSLSDLGCTDMSMALKQAKDFLLANEDKENVLICYGNKPYSPSRYRYPVTIYGDGGVAVLVNRTDRNQIVDVDLKSDGRYWDLFKVEYKDRYFEDYQEVCSDTRKYGFELAILSQKKFLELNEAVLERNQLKKDDIDHFILQNISSRAYTFYETAFEVKLSPVCRMNLGKYGHLGPTDIMLNYKTGLDQGLFNEGDHVLVMNNSPVASWSSVLIKV